MESSRELVLPGVGEILSLDSASQAARAFARLKELEDQIKDARRECTDALRYYSSVFGSRTLRFDDAPGIELTADEETLIDAEQLEMDFRAAGMPESVIRDIVVETVTYKVNLTKVRAAAKTNPDYAAALEKNSRVVPKTQYAKLI